MRACVQRVRCARVTVDEAVVGEIGRGLFVLLGVARQDSDRDARQLVEKISQLRVFPDEEGKMNRSLEDIAGSMLVVSQFTLLGDCRKGRRPSFMDAAQPELGQRLYETFVNLTRERGIEVATGQFRALMDIELINDGPVTLLLDSRKLF